MERSVLEKKLFLIERNFITKNDINTSRINLEEEMMELVYNNKFTRRTFLEL